MNMQRKIGNRAFDFSFPLDTKFQSEARSAEGGNLNKLERVMRFELAKRRRKPKRN